MSGGEFFDRNGAQLCIGHPVTVEYAGLEFTAKGRIARIAWDRIHGTIVDVREDDTQHLRTAPLQRVVYDWSRPARPKTEDSR